MVDITNWKFASEELESSELKYRELFENAPDGISYYDNKGTLLECNKAYADMLGYEIEELISTKSVDMIAEYDKVLFAKNFPILIKEGRNLIEKVDHIRKDNKIISLRRNVIALYDDSGEFEGVIAFSSNTVFHLLRRGLVQSP